ncbi:hypothetical protein [Dyadobacter bucti]|jgi:hypothetical protein|uniref:hypothetical protein n=1 Tax=Dyadobacter bucti TaxID=2572203 RepID=UPI0011092CC1|nr:hypothetical protein [Dyadobacter bucti]
MSSSIDSSVKLTKPFSSDTDLDKRDLQQDAELYRDKLELQWSDLKHDATNYGKQALVIGGVIATTYVIMNAVLPDYKKGKKTVEEEPEIRVEKKKSSKKKAQFAVGQAVQSLAWTLAVGWARQKLKHLIADDQKTE